MWAAGTSDAVARAHAGMARGRLRVRSTRRYRLVQRVLVDADAVVMVVPGMTVMLAGFVLAGFSGWWLLLSASGLVVMWASFAAIVGAGDLLDRWQRSAALAEVGGVGCLPGAMLDDPVLLGQGRAWLARQPLGPDGVLLVEQMAAASDLTLEQLVRLAGLAGLAGLR